jgi:hypothetical protein
MVRRRRKGKLFVLLLGLPRFPEHGGKIVLETRRVWPLNHEH